MMRELLPQVPARERHGFLMEFTCFPFGDPERDLRPQLVKLAKEMKRKK